MAKRKLLSRLMNQHTLWIFFAIAKFNRFYLNFRNVCQNNDE